MCTHCRRGLAGARAGQLGGAGLESLAQLPQLVLLRARSHSPLAPELRKEQPGQAAADLGTLMECHFAPPERGSTTWAGRHNV